MLETLNSAARCGDDLRRSPDRPLRRACRASTPPTSHELADAAGLDERYVREWLGAMTTGRIVEYEPATGQLPAAGGACELAHARCVAGQSRRHRAMDPDARRRRGRHRRVLPRGWRRPVRAVRSLPRRHGRGERPDGAVGALLAHPPARIRVPRSGCEAGISALDLGCGRGRALLMLAERFPSSSFLGLRPLDRGRRERDARRPQSAASRTSASTTRDLSTFDVDAEPESFELVTDLRRRARSGASARDAAWAFAGRSLPRASI